MLIPNLRMDPVPTRRMIKWLGALTTAGSLGVVLVATTPPSATASSSVPPTSTPSPSASASASPSTAPTVTTVVKTSTNKHHRHFRVCRPKKFFKILFHVPRSFWIPHAHFVDGPAPAKGADMSAAIRREHSVHFEMQLENIAEREKAFPIERLLLRLRKHVKPLLSEEHHVEIGHQYVVHVAPHKFGHLRYRVMGERIGFQEWWVRQSCRKLRIVSGVASFPTRKEGWQYWESKHA